MEADDGNDIFTADGSLLEGPSASTEQSDLTSKYGITYIVEQQQSDKVEHHVAPSSSR